MVGSTVTGRKKIPVVPVSYCEKIKIGRSEIKFFKVYLITVNEYQQQQQDCNGIVFDIHLYLHHVYFQLIQLLFHFGR
jgi:hypothetical protein